MWTEVVSTLAQLLFVVAQLTGPSILRSPAKEQEQEASQQGPLPVQGLLAR